ncbi:MAG: hypothetical protein ACI35Q_01345 [Marinilabiliaceae bacterium]
MRNRTDNYGNAVIAIAAHVAATDAKPDVLMKLGRANVLIKREQSELVRFAEREKRRVKPNVLIKREQSEPVRFAEREKRRVKPNVLIKREQSGLVRFAEREKRREKPKGESPRPTQKKRSKDVRQE